MLQHLFHLARKDGGFTFYGEPRRLAALYYLDFSFIVLLLASSAAAAILLLLLPALRRRFTTLALSFSALWTGAAIGYCLMIPEWQVGTVRLPVGTPLTYHISQPAASRYSVGLGLGLRSANITLLALDVKDIYYDETVDLTDTLAGMRAQYSAALVRGLPIPILVIYEQVASSGADGFSWPFYVRQAGYYCAWILKFALAVWVYALVIHCSVPARSADYFTVASLLILATPIVYSFMLSGTKSHIYVNGVPLVLKYGACYYTCIFTGVFSTTVGCVLMVISRRRPKKVVTAFSVEEWYKSQRQLVLARIPDVNMEIEDEISSKANTDYTH